MAGQLAPGGVRMRFQLAGSVLSHFSHARRHPFMRAVQTTPRPTILGHGKLSVHIPGHDMNALSHYLGSLQCPFMLCGTSNDFLQLIRNDETMPGDSHGSD